MKSLLNCTFFLDVLLQSFNCNLDIIVLSEAFINDLSPQHTIPGYNCAKKSGQITRNEGLLIFYKNFYTCKVFPEADVVSDCCALFIELSCHLQPNTDNIERFQILGIYRTPSQSNTSPFTTSLDTFLTSNRTKQPIIIGDLNINIHESAQNNTYSDDYLTMLSSHGYIQCIHNYTRTTETSNTLIDHIFIPNKMFKPDIAAFVLETTVTDHFSQLIIIPNSSVEQPKPSSTTQEIKRIDYEALNNALRAETWENVLEIEDANNAYTCFEKTYKQHIDEHTNFKTRKITNKHKHLKPWMNNSLIQSIRFRDKLFKIAKYKTALIEYAKQYSNNLKRQIKITKNNYYATKLLETKTDIKKTWKIVNEITGGNKTNKNNTPQSFIINGTEIITKGNESLIADQFNYFYTQVGISLASKITINKHRQQQMLNNIPTNTSTIFLQPTTEIEISNIISKLKSNKATGVDQITTLTLKNTKPYITVALCHVANIMLNTGRFPDKLKVARVTPCFKDGSKQLLTNYRPISVLPGISKIFEKIILARLNSFITQHKLISKKQYGFQEKKGTSDAIADLTDEMYNSIDKGALCLLTLFDLKKCFDTIPHTLLLIKLNKIGFRGIGLSLIKDYLSNRTQAVMLEATKSKEMNISPFDSKVGTSYSCPQGTTLSPVFFNLFLNDLLNLDLEGNIAAFADDTRLLNTGSNRKELYESANRDLQKIRNWFNDNQLTLNLQKTVYIEFAHRQNKLQIPNEPTYSLKDITQVQSHKYLGIVIDHKLKWTEHINILTKKIRRTIYKFLLLRDIMSIENMRTIYMALVQAHLNYGITAWGGAAQNTISKLKVAQKRIIKIIYQKGSRFPSDELFQMSQLQSIDNLYKLESLSHLHKHITTAPLFEHIHDTRYTQAKPLQIPKTQLNNTQKQHFHIGTKLYNILPTEIKNTNSTKLFRKHVQKWLQTNSNNTE